MTQQDQLLRRTAERARLRTEYLGWILAQYGEIEGIDERKVQEGLHISSKNWPRLHLCLRPRADYFLPDVTAIATEFDIDRDMLAAMIRKVEGLHVLATTKTHGSGVQQTSDCPGHLLAARSRPKKRTKGGKRQGNGHES